MNNMKHRRDAGAALVYAVLVILLASAIAAWLGTWHHYRRTIALCSTSNLHLSVGSSEGTAGTQYTHVVLTNQGSGSCLLVGYPAVFLADTGMTILGGGAAANALYPVTNITLAPSQSAHVVVGFPDHTNFGAGVCSAASVYLKVYPPGATTPLSTPLVQYSCPGFSTTAFRAGS